jgi:RNA polymerase sigma-70 factor (ECF subfamily)
MLAGREDLHESSRSASEASGGCGRTERPLAAEGRARPFIAQVTGGGQSDKAPFGARSGRFDRNSPDGRVSQKAVAPPGKVPPPGAESRYRELAGAAPGEPRGRPFVDDVEQQAERAFIERLKRRDERAFNELVQAYEQRVYRLVLRMLGRSDEAEDMAQEVFVQVFKAIDQFRGDAKLSTWLYRIAVNICKNRVKYLSRRHSDQQQEFEPMAERIPLSEAKGVTFGDVARPDHMVEGLQAEQIVHRCILELEPDFREVLILRDVEDLTYEEIAEVTNLPDGTVKSRIHRARGMLKVKVERAMGEKIP